MQLLFLSIYGKLDFSFPNVNAYIGGDQKGLPRMSDTFESRCMSSTIKSTGTKNSLILTRIFSRMPSEYRTDWSATCKYIDVRSSAV